MQTLVQDRLTLQWEYSGDQFILLVESMKCNGLALAFNLSAPEYNLSEVDILRFRFGRDWKQFELNDSFGYTDSVVLNDDFFGENVQNWKILGYTYDESKLYMKVSRVSKTQDDREYDFSQQVDVNIGYMLAIGDMSLIYQNYNRGVVLVQLSQIEPATNDKWRDFVMIGHPIFLFIFWGVLADVGIFFARYLRSYPKYAKVHGMIFLFQSIVTYIFFFAMIAYNKQKVQEIHFYSGIIVAHLVVGIVVVTLMTIQLLFGMLVKNNLESLNGSVKIYRIKIIHRFLGYFLYLLTKAQVAIGVHLYVESYQLRFWFYAYYLFLFMIKVSIEILYYFEVSLLSRTRVTYLYVEIDKNQIYENLLDKINQNVPRHDIVKEFPGLNYLLLREAVYDVSDFNHPGGQFILDKVCGREVGRYFYGAYPVQGMKTKSHRHTNFAINYIETRYIGDYRQDCCPILYNLENQAVPTDKYIWKFQEVRHITEDIALFVYASHFFQVRQQLKGVNWMGRYFYIKPFGAGLNLVERSYSIVLCLSDENIIRRNQMINYFKSQMLDQNGIATTISEYQLLNNEIGFVVKKHQFSRNMSRFLHCTSHKPYEITGPYGFGLELNNDSTGIHYVFCNGTGVLPFLDLLDYLLKKALYTILHDQRGKDVADKINSNDEDYYNTLGNDFQLILHGAFESPDSLVGYPILQDLEFICSTFNLNLFKMYLKFSNKSENQQHMQQYIYVSDSQNSRYSIAYIKKWLKYKPTKIYVCGSPVFEESVMTNLRIIGVPKKYIVNI